MRIKHDGHGIHQVCGWLDSLQPGRTICSCLVNSIQFIQGWFYLPGRFTIRPGDYHGINAAYSAQSDHLFIIHAGLEPAAGNHLAVKNILSAV